MRRRRTRGQRRSREPYHPPRWGCPVPWGSDSQRIRTSGSSAMDTLGRGGSPEGGGKPPILDAGPAPTRDRQGRTHLGPGARYTGSAVGAARPPCGSRLARDAVAATIHAALRSRVADAATSGAGWGCPTARQTQAAAGTAGRGSASLLAGAGGRAVGCAASTGAALRITLTLVPHTALSSRTRGTA